MKDKDIRIRTATRDDTEDILEIYAPYVKKTVIPFESEIPSPQEFQWMRSISRK